MANTICKFFCKTHQVHLLCFEEDIDNHSKYININKTNIIHDNKCELIKSVDHVLNTVHGSTGIMNEMEWDSLLVDSEVFSQSVQEKFLEDEIKELEKNRQTE